jgi:exosome complex protein LRP1
LSAKLAEKIAEERARALLKAAESKKRGAEDASQPAAGSGPDGASSAGQNKNKKPKTKGKPKSTKSKK